MDAEKRVTITNENDEVLEIPLDTHDIFEKGILDRDIDRMASPLEEGRINAAHIKARSADEQELQERMDASERDYFVCENKELTSTQETWLEVQLNSLTKSTNNGYLHLGDRTRVAYRYKGDTPGKLYHIFGTHNDTVRIKCIAHMDENLKTIRVDILDIDTHQGELFADPNTDLKE